MPKPTITTAYGLYIDLPNETASIASSISKTDAQRVVEVCVNIEGTKYEMTWEEFKKRITE